MFYKINEVALFDAVAAADLSCGDAAIVNQLKHLRLAYVQKFLALAARQ